MTADPRLARITQIARKLETVRGQDEALRKQRDELILELDLPLRELAQAAGLSHEAVRKIVNRKEQT